MEEITSVSNSKIKETVKLHQKKYRNETGLFLLEGHKPILEAFLAGIEIKAVFTTEKHIEKFDFIKEKIILVTQAVLEKLSTTESMPEAAAIATQIKYSKDTLKNKTRILLVENIKDAGNLGTLIRSACAFSMDGIILCGETVDIYNPKVIRSTVGALFKLPIIKLSLDETKELFKNSKLIATVVNYKDTIHPEKINYKEPFILMLGSEANGLTKEAINLSDIKTTIPISSATESLNLSTAGSILLYISSR